MGVTASIRRYKLRRIQSGESASAPLRLLFRTQTDASALAGVLNQLKADGDTFLAVRETKY